MTKHGGTFKLSGETRDLLKENQAFFQDILDLYDPQDPEKIPLKFSSRDPESRSEAKVQPNGEVEVSFVVPLDDDTNPENGRIYVRDTFLFDSSEKKLKSYQRSFDHNGKGEGGWETWLEKYRAALGAKTRDINDPVVQKFAFSAGTSFGRSITDDKGITLPEFRSAFGREHRYLDSAHNLVAKNWQDLRYKVKDKLNHYTLVRKGDQLNITFHIAIDDDDEPANGRLILSDTIGVDAKTWELKDFARNWRPAPEVAEDDSWKTLAANMNQVWANAEEAEKKQVAEEAGAFVRNMAPLLLTGVDLKPEDALKALMTSAKSETGAAQPSPWAQRLEKDPRRGEATARILTVMNAVAGESLGRKHDEQSGWWNSKLMGRRPLDLAGAQNVMNAVFAKSLEAAKSKPKATAFEVLNSLTLDGEEAKARDALLADKLLVELNSIGGEADPELRDEALLHFADNRLFRRASMPIAAQALLTSFTDASPVKAKAKSLLATIEGKGSFGAKFEAFLPRFTEQVAHPSMLIAMGGAPFLGVAAEGLGLAGLSRLGLAAGWSGRVGTGGRWLAGAIGLTGEAFAFTALHQSLESAFHDPNKLRANFKNEFLSGVMLFGSMRAAHAAVNPLTARFLSKAPIEAELLSAPTGRLLINPRWGGGNPHWFNKWVTMPVLNHGSGIAAMHLANTLSRRWKLMPDNGQDGASHFLDSAFSYGTAVIGFNLANRLTMGRLQGGLGETKLRLDSMGKELSKVPTPKARNSTNPPRSASLVFKFNNHWKIDARQQKVIWIGSKPGRTKSEVEYFDNYAELNIGPADTVSEYHAVMTRDQSDTFWYLADAGSTYGTVVNGKRLASGEHVLLKNTNLIDLGDGFPLRIDTEGNLIKPDKKVQTFVRLPQTPAQKRLAPPPMADAVPFEQMYPSLDIKPSAKVELAQLRDTAKGDVTRLLSDRTSWGKADTALIYIDTKGRWVMENYSRDPIEIQRPADGQRPEERWTLQHFDPKTASEEQKAMGRHDWVFLESGDRIAYGKTEMEFIAHEEPLGEKNPSADLRGALGFSDAPPPGGKGRPSVPPGRRDSKPPAADSAADADPEGVRPTLNRIDGDSEPPVGGDFNADDPMGERVTMVDIKPVPAAAYRGADSSEITLAGPRKFTNISRIEGFLPQDYLTRNGIPLGTPVFELRIGGRTIRSDMQSTSYIFGKEPEVKQPYQSGITIDGRLVEKVHAEIFLAENPETKELEWFLTDRDSSFGTFAGERKLDAGANREDFLLRSGSVFTLGEPGKNGAAQFTFKLPWVQDIGKPASVFPADLVGHLPAAAAPMELVDNFGNLLMSADRTSSRYILGRDPSPRETPNTKAFTLNRDRIDDEHCEIFVDDVGQWYLRSLTVEEKTYIEGKEVIGGATVPIRPNAEIALGGDPTSGHGVTFILRQADYVIPERPSSRPTEIAGRAETVNGNSDSETPTVKPPQPGPALGAKPVPPPPRRRSREGAEDLNATLVMGALTQADLARQSVEMKEEAPLPPPKPNVIRKTNPPPIKEASPPPAPPPAAPAPEKPKAEVMDEADFGDISREVIDTAGPDDFQFGPRRTKDEGTPPPSPNSQVPPDVPQNAPLPKLELRAADPALTALHPDLRSKTLADLLSRWVSANKEEVKSHLNDIRAFPRHNLSGPILVGSSPMFYLQVVRLVEAGSKAPAKLSDATKTALKSFADPKNAADFGQGYQISYDGQSLLWASDGFKGGDTSLTLNVRPEAEPTMLKAVHDRLLQLDVPVEVIAPLAAESGQPTFLGLRYRAEDAAKVHRKVREMLIEFPEAWGDAALPFSQPLAGPDGRPLPGTGVMEYFIEGTSPTPLDHRFRSVIIRSHASYVKQANEARTYSQPEHFRQILQLYQQVGYDMANPGFRAGSLDSSHRSLIPDLYFPE